MMPFPVACICMRGAFDERGLKCVVIFEKERGRDRRNFEMIGAWNNFLAQNFISVN